ncbi:MAG: hypothetical protein EA402_12915 [Planctomycetota bacterium]|nr:MAG: hypothetical protein EA402_12915 [Planctomycetota bacterium]
MGSSWPGSFATWVSDLVEIQEIVLDLHKALSLDEATGCGASYRFFPVKDRFLRTGTLSASWLGVMQGLRPVIADLRAPAKITHNAGF